MKSDGTPGPNFAKAHQHAAYDEKPHTFLLNPKQDCVPGNGPALRHWSVGPTDSYITGDSLSLAQSSENGLPASYYPSLVSGGTGLTSHTPDTRISNVNALQRVRFN